MHTHTHDRQVEGHMTRLNLSPEIQVNTQHTFTVHGPYKPCTHTPMTGR